MSIYRLYAQNGQSAGFWIQHRSWSNACAWVQSVGGRRRGALPGRAPFHNYVEVAMQGYDVRSGRPMELEASSLPPPHDRSYSRIAQPAWAHGFDEVTSLEQV
jgi:hypothetical protein